MANSSSRGGVLKVLGALVVLVGLVAAVGLWVVGGQRRTDAIEAFARAPLGCDTTLDFVETGRYTLYVETSGRTDSIKGDCDVDGEYSSNASRVELTLLDPDGDELELDPVRSGATYDVDGYVGKALFEVDIAQTDDHVLRVESPEGDPFVVAVGRDPNQGVALLRALAVIAGLAGLVVGIALFVAGVRRGRPVAVAPPWNPGAPVGFTPVQAPGGPPVYGQQAGPPVYAPAPPQYQPAPYQQPQYQQPAAQQPQYQQPQYQQPVAQQPQYQQPQYQQPQYQQPQYQQPIQPAPFTPQPPNQPDDLPPNPGLPQPPLSAPPPPSGGGVPNIAGQPSFGSGAPGVPQDLSGSRQPIDWSPAPPRIAPEDDDATRPAPPN